MTTQNQKDLEYNMSKTANQQYCQALIDAAPKCSNNWAASTYAAQEMFEKANLSFRDAYLNRSNDNLYDVALCLVEIHKLCAA